MHFTKAFAIALAISLGLAACAAPPALTTPKTPLPVKWQARVTRTISRPAVADGRVYVVNELSTLLALDAATGAKRWEAPLTLASHRDDPVGVDGGRVFVAVNGDQGKIVAFDAKTGTKAWEVALGQYNGTRHPVASAGRVFFETPVTNGSPKLHAVDGATGKTAWAFNLDGYPATAIVVANGLVFVGVNTWDGATVKSRRLIALDASSGDERWELPLELNLSGIAADDDHIYIGLDGGVVLARRAATGDGAWTARVSGKPSAAPSVANGVVYAVTSDGEVAALNASDGVPRWRVNLKSAVLTQVAVDGGVAYLGTNDGYLHAVDTSTGAEKWKVQSPEQRPVVPGPYVPAMSTTPVVADALLLYFNAEALNALGLR